MQNDIQEETDKRKALKEMELFVLDNSLRESTVGQLRGHTIENKWKIYEQVRVQICRFQLMLFLILVRSLTVQLDIFSGEFATYNAWFGAFCNRREQFLRVGCKFAELCINGCLENSDKENTDLRPQAWKTQT